MKYTLAIILSAVNASIISDYQLELIINGLVSILTVYFVNKFQNKRFKKYEIQDSKN